MSDHHPDDLFKMVLRDLIIEVADMGWKGPALVRQLRDQAMARAPHKATEIAEFFADIDVSAMKRREPV